MEGSHTAEVPVRLGSSRRSWRKPSKSISARTRPWPPPRNKTWPLAERAGFGASGVDSEPFLEFGRRTESHRARGRNGHRRVGARIVTRTRTPPAHREGAEPGHPK